jgi:signal transduction histidine kinase
VLQPRVLSLNTVVTDVGKLLQRLIGEDIELALDLQADLHPVKADEGQLGQVLLNLAANARDAMPTGGTLTVQTANVLLDDASTPPGRLDLEPGPYVMLGVSDTGIGMDVETQTRIFEPFFTTKEQGKGTGLGLSMVYGIVKQSDGDMLVHSEVGLGTTFKIYLPRAPSEDEAPPVVAEADGSLRGTGTVPVVEEEDGIRDLTRTVVDQRDTRS